MNRVIHVCILNECLVCRQKVRLRDLPYLSALLVMKSMKRSSRMLLEELWIHPLMNVWLLITNAVHNVFF